MTEIKTIENLLSQVNTIRKSYEKVAKVTGENFNVFSILGLERSEVKAHSAFIAHLLNAQGKHGFGHAFLDVFVSIVKTKNFENTDFIKESQYSSDYNFKTVNSYAKKEHYIGNVKISEDLSKSAGGSIDILIRERPATNKVIMIENKIDAGDQPHQLLRYRNAFPNGLLIYLTLNNKISSEKSAKTFPYKCMSYENDIVNWLEECQKIAYNNPVVRETIKQYKNLIKKMTNQNINSEIDKEILKLITESEDKLKSAQKINSALLHVDSKLKLKLDEIILKGKTIKNKYEENKIYNNIKILPRFQYKGIYVIRFDFFFANSENDVLVYQIHTNNSKLCLETSIWGKGQNYQKIEVRMNAKENFIIKPEYKYDTKVDKILNDIDTNMNIINNYLNILP